MECFLDKLLLSSTGQILIKLVILLQIVRVHPGTHLVKNHESQSRTNESQLKKKKESQIENAWAFM